jgi:DNA ligase-1
MWTTSFRSTRRREEFEAMQLKQLVDISERVGATRSKKEKISLIAGLLQKARKREIALAAHCLSGQLPQGRLGVGWKMLQEATQGLSGVPPSLKLIQVDTYFRCIAGEEGPRSTLRKIQAVRELFSRCNERERAFVVE